jgi:hypothetical protein
VVSKRQPDFDASLEFLKPPMQSKTPAVTSDRSDSHFPSPM